MEQRYKAKAMRIPLYAAAVGAILGLGYNTFTGVQQSVRDKERINRETIQKAPENLQRLLGPYVNPDIVKLRDYIGPGLKEYEIDVDEDGYTDVVFKDIKTGEITYFRNIDNLGVKEQKINPKLRKRLEMLIESEDKYRQDDIENYPETPNNMT